MSSASLVVLFIVVAGYMATTGAKSEAKVTVAKPTTIWPLAPLLFTGGLALGLVYVAVQIGATGRFLAGILILAAIVVSTSGTTAPTRVVYDRGATSWLPGEAFGALILVVFVVVAAAAR